MQIETRLSEQIARYLDLAASESKLTAANMANLDTPGYRALGDGFARRDARGLNGVNRERVPGCTGEAGRWADRTAGRK